MNAAFPLAEIQTRLQSEKLDGWLFYQFHGCDPIAPRILKLPETKGIASRRWFYFVPAKGEPQKLVHRIESGMLDTLPGGKRIFLSWRELRDGLRDTLGGAKRVAMQYSPENAIPYVSRVDAGTIELVRALGTEVVSSGDLVAAFEASLSPDGLASHEEAAKHLYRIVEDAYAEIGKRLAKKQAVNEYDIARYIMDRFESAGMASHDAPIVGVGPNSGNPHYEPTETASAPMKAGDFVLIDLWAKMKRPGAIYADITWVGFLGDRVPDKIAEVFAIVAAARDAGIQRAKDGLAKGERLRGCDVDDAVRAVIAAKGYADKFIHRTGHSIGEEVHGNGANMDNLETKDERRVLPRSLFSIEPGIYLPEFGVRCEVDVYAEEKTARVTGGKPQDRVLTVSV
ncbi:MAG: M24 family metallopeptidase [Planctomycetes bacterium]|nr:M24 family metallopeptidase [Planctomycetota bacterium]